MRLLGFVPQAVFAVVALRLGVRLLRRSLRTGAWPERCLGLAVVLMTVAFPLFVLSRAPAVFGSSTGNYVATIGATMLSTAVMALYVFTWVVFRQREGMAVLFVAAGSSLAYGAGVGLVVSGWDAHSMQEALPWMRPYAIAMLVSIGLAFGWSSVEALLCWLQQRRQLRIGLSDPVVMNRFLLWTVGGSSNAAVTVALAAMTLSGVVVMQDPLAMACMGIAGCVASVSWWLAFFPPRWYVRAIRRSHR